MPFNVSTFTSAISDTGLAKPALFECLIVKSPIVDRITNFGKTQQNLRFRIESVNFIGRNISTFDQNYHGPVRSIAYRQAQQTCSMTVILSQDMREREFFMQWQDYALGHARTDKSGRVFPNMFDTGYYDDYVGTIYIDQYSYGDDKLNKTQELINQENKKNNVDILRERQIEKLLKYRISLEEAYPISVNDISMSWIEEGYARLRVDMKYFYSREFHGYSTNYNLNQALKSSQAFTEF